MKTFQSFFCTASLIAVYQYINIYFIINSLQKKNIMLVTVYNFGYIFKYCCPIKFNILPLPIDRNVPSVGVFATALQNICSYLATTEKQAPAGLNVIICFDYNKLLTFLCFLSDNNESVYTLKKHANHLLLFWILYICFRWKGNVYALPSMVIRWSYSYEYFYQTELMILVSGMNNSSWYMLLKIRLIYIILDLRHNFSIAPSFRLREKA